MVAAGSRLLRAALAIGLCCAGGAAAAAAPVTPGALLASSLAAAGKERSVHYVAASTYGQTSVTQVGDVGLAEGIQRITYTTKGKTGHITLVVTVEGLFLKGDGFALSGYLGFPAAPAQKDSGSWLLVKRSNAAYGALAAAVTLSSFVSELQLRAPLSQLHSATVDGIPSFALGGHQASGTKNPLSAVLYARASGPPLPVEETLNGGATHETITISKWNETVYLVVPSHSKPKTAPKKTGPGLVA